ncbi:MAG: cytidylate kinase family protein [Thermoproteota archaeon]|nr:cytidylate kinase family protein [Thermoproteota archaeon]
MGSDHKNNVEKELHGADGKKLSIVISGWPAVGKTTIAEKISENFDLKLWNGGDILKMMAYEKGYSSALNNDWWDTDEAIKFMTERNKNPNFDKEVDKRLIDLVKKGNVVVTSYTLPWISDASVKFWLHGSIDNRAKRMATRDNLDIETAKKIVIRRDNDNKNIYRKLYNFEFGENLDVFDFALNTDILSLDALIGISNQIVKNISF